MLVNWYTGRLAHLALHRENAFFEQPDVDDLPNHLSKAEANKPMWKYTRISVYQFLSGQDQLPRQTVVGSTVECETQDE